MVMKFYKESFIKAEPSEVYRWHMAPGAFLRLKPPWENVELVNSEKELFEGARALIRIFPLANTRTIHIDWLAEHTDIELNKGFTDFQVRGPFKRWRHRHRFQEHNGGCLLQDEIEFELLAHPLSIPLYPYIRSKLEAMFTYRHEITQKDLDSKGANSMNVLISGSSGLVGGALVPYLSTAGHSVTRLKRSLSNKNDSKEILWSPGAGELDAAALEGIDAVVHLAGENIASGRWTDAKKKELVDSRIQSTRLLVDSFKKMEKKPSVFICASAIGFYGERGDEELTEESSAGSGFLADRCKDWEKEAAKAEALGIRERSRVTIPVPGPSDIARIVIGLYVETLVITQLVDRIEPSEASADHNCVKVRARGLCRGHISDHIYLQRGISAQTIVARCVFPAVKVRDTTLRS